MHSHIHGISQNVMNLYSARALDKSESAQRAADTRKKLLAAACEEIEAESDWDANWLVRPGYETAGYKGRGRRATRPRGEGEASETDAVFEAISVWA